VLTAPAYRRHGLAGLLVNRVLEYLRVRGVAQIKLDASDMGIELYRSAGFVEECPVERWIREAGPAAVAESLAAGMDLMLDREIFGADRSALLRDLAREGAVEIPGSGFAMYRPGRVAPYFGPCIATSAGAAQRMVEWFLARHGGGQTYW